MATMQPRDDLFPSSWSALLSEPMEQSWDKQSLWSASSVWTRAKGQRDLEVGLVLIYKVVLLIVSVLIHLTSSLKGSMNQYLYTSPNLL